MLHSHNCFRMRESTKGMLVPIRRMRATPWLTAAGLIVTTAFSNGARAADEHPLCLSVCPPNNSVTVPNTSVFGSAQAGITDVGTQFMQHLDTILSDRNAASPTSNPQGGGADTPYSKYRTWFESYGLASRTDAQADFPGDHRRTWGGLAGAAINLTPNATVGLSVDQSRTKIDLTGLPQHGTINLTQIGAIGAFGSGPWQLNTMAIYGFGNVHSQRDDIGGMLVASYGARLWASMAELSYYIALPQNSRIVPRLTVDGTWTHTDAFTEVGGAFPVSGSSVDSSRGRVLIGAEFGHTWLVDRTIMDFLVYGRFVDNFVQNIGTMRVSDPAGGFAPQPVIGVRESTLGADAGATLSAKLTDMMRVYVVYDARLRSNFNSQTGTVGIDFRF